MIVTSYDSNNLKNKNNMSISNNAQQLDKIQHPFRIKAYQKVGTEGTCLNKIKAINGKPQLAS